MKETSEGLKKVKITSKGQLMEYKLLAMFIIPILIGLGCGYIFNQVADTTVVEGRGRTLMDDPRLFVASAVIASSAALLFSWGDEITMVGIGIATALLPPLVAIGFSLGKHYKGNKNRTLKKRACISYCSHRIEFINLDKNGKCIRKNDRFFDPECGFTLGDMIGPNGNFSQVSDISKWILSFAMLLGRLEIFAVLVLFLPSFWRS